MLLAHEYANDSCSSPLSGKLGACDRALPGGEADAEGQIENLKDRNFRAERIIRELPIFQDSLKEKGKQK